MTAAPPIRSAGEWWDSLGSAERGEHASHILRDLSAFARTEGWADEWDQLTAAQRLLIARYREAHLAHLPGYQ